MLFCGEYWDGVTNSQISEVIEKFIEDDCYKVMVIIDPRNRLEMYKTICQEFKSELNIEPLFAVEINEFDGKTVYVSSIFDKPTRNFIMKHWAFVAFIDS